MNGIIYCATAPNGKLYVGQTVQTLNQRKSQHKWHAENYKDNFIFHKAIRKYGFENFTWEVLESGIDNIGELNQKEQYWIQQKNSYCENGYGYNMSLGGDNYQHMYLFTDADMEVILEEYKQCGNSYILAKKYNTTSAVIIRNIKRVCPNWKQYSYNGKGHQSIFDDEQKKAIYEEFKQIGSIPQLAEKYQTTVHTIRRLLLSLDSNYTQYTQKAHWGTYTRNK